MRNIMAVEESSSNLVSDASAWLRTFKKGLRENLVSTCDHSLAANSE